MNGEDAFEKRTTLELVVL